MEETGTLGFQNIIDNYEELVKDLTSELSSVKNDHEKLKSKVSEIIADNQRLSEELSNALRQQEDAARIVFQEENQLVNNLKQQLELTMEEKEYTLRLWKNAVSTIDSLEEELRIHQAGIEGFIPKKDHLHLKSSYEDKIRSLEQKLAVSDKKLQQTLKQSTNEIETKKQELEKCLENQTGALQIIKNLEDEVLSLQNRLQDCSQGRIKLQKTIQQKENQLQVLIKKNNECIGKVKEAVNVVESALIEKDAALFREQKLKDEIKNSNEILIKIEKETKDKIKVETEIIKREWEEKIRTVSEELRNAKDETKIKSMELENLIQKCNLLENEIDRLQKGNINIDESNTSKLLILEKNLESTFQKLLVSEKQNIQLIAEKDSIKNDLNQMAEIFERNLKTKEVEINTFKSQVQQLNNQLEEKKTDANVLFEKLEFLKNKIELMENNFKIQKENYEKILNSSQEEKILEVCKKHKEEIKQFQSKLQMKDELIQKWRTETRSIVEDLQKLIDDLKLEINNLKHENKKLRQKSDEDNQKLNQYKIFLDVVSQDVNKISNLTVNKNIK